MSKHQPPLGLLLRVRAGQAETLARDVCRRLNADAIAPALLKSALMNATVYADRPPSPVGDVDLLIHPNDAAVAEGSLIAWGGRMLARAGHATTWSFSRSPLLLDLHTELVSPPWFALSSREVLARGTLTTGLIPGVQLRELAPLDVYVHLVADFAKSRRGGSYIERLRDLRQWPRHTHLDPVVAAAALEAAGAARAARYVLAVSRRFEGDRFAGAVVDALAPDPLGRLLASVAVDTMGFGDVRWTTTVAAHALNQNLWRGFRSLSGAILSGTSGRGRAADDGTRS